MLQRKLFVFGTGVLVLALAFSVIALPATAQPVNEKAIVGGSYAPLKKPTPPPPPPPPPSPGDGIVKRYAVVVGISDYKAISDLSYCDEDANDWYSYLNAHGYTVKVYGDHTSTYLRFDGVAKESNVKAAIQSMVAAADGDDIIAFVSSGHGTTISGMQVLCMWDMNAGENGEDGVITDIELKNLFASAVAKVFIFLDHCNSGGMNEIMSNSNAANVYMTTTCGPRGYGYDVPEYQNGKWTYWFLEKGLIGQGFTTMESCFSWAYTQYNARGQDAPMQFDGNTAVNFTL
ncbi:MAG: caspase family protein [Thermoplasmata archaeon]